MTHETPTTATPPPDLIDCAALRENVGTLAVALARWAYRDDSTAQPGVRQAANTAIEALDAALAEAHRIRARLVDQIRRSDDATQRRVDQLLARCRAERDEQGDERALPGACANAHAHPGQPCRLLDGCCWTPVYGDAGTVAVDESGEQNPSQLQQLIDGTLPVQAEVRELIARSSLGEEPAGAEEGSPR